MTIRGESEMDRFVRGGMDITGGHVDDWLVGGWFTPDYRHYAEALADDLSALGHPYHFWSIPKRPGGWKANTLGKANRIAKAMNTYRECKLIWLDADCRLRGSLSPLTSIPCDVAMLATTKWRSNRHWLGLKPNKADLHCWSGTMVLSPTEAARRMVSAWVRLSYAARPGDDDETTLGQAIAMTGELTVHCLDSKWSAGRAAAVARDVIVHAGAHMATSRAGRFKAALIAARGSVFGARSVPVRNSQVGA